MTDLEELTAINAAIADLLAGTIQSYSLDGNNVTKLDITSLTARRDELTRRITRSQRPGGAIRSALV